MWFLILVLAAGTVLTCGTGGIGVGDADSILKKIGFPRGVCVLLGDNDCTLAINLARKSHLTIYVQVLRSEDADRCRRAADADGLYGSRIFVDAGVFSRIHLADNIADALVAVGPASSISEKEALRVVRPQGTVLIGGKELKKPIPDGADDWSHPYHGPDNNPQSNDRIARAPYLTQYLALPYYAPLPQLTVSSAGRMFRATGHIAFKPREEEYLNTLAAYNGYNGTMLWKRNLVPGIMIHRNTMIATPDELYVGDNVSCKVIDAATGDIKREIAPPADVAGGTFWKWMAHENGVLYAIIGEQEMTDPEVRKSYSNHGWPWNPLSKGFNLPENPWGFGGTVLAMNPENGRVIWSYREEEPIDSRAVCMKNGRMFLFRFGSYLTCLDTVNGAVLWRRTAANDPEVFAALGKNLNRQDWQTNWRTTAYLKCSDRALYFAGPMMDKLIVLSAEDGSVMWHHPYDNYQLVLREDGLYGISGPWANNVSKLFNPLTGEILGEFDIGRRACARPTGAADAIFIRANDGSLRFDLATHRPQYLSPMRPDCFDGVTIANGLLYWWPSTCDCQLTLYGATSLGPAGNHDFYAQATVADRLEKTAGASAQTAQFTVSPNDWPTFRANNKRTAQSGATVPETAGLLWEYAPASLCFPTAPVTAGGLVFTGDSHGVVKAFDADSGAEKWSTYTGGSIRIAPTVWNDRVYVGSGDGWLYVLEAQTGRVLWRFRAAPEERKIPVYGQLLSTWPVASGVLVENSVAYAAAGIANYDGTNVYALDAKTGDIVWQNNTSGHLNREARTGIGVQGHLLLNDGKLYMAGGNAVSPAVYDITDGRCLNNGELLNICESICLRGWELYLVGDRVAVGGQPFYGHPDFPVSDATVYEKILHVATGDRDILWLDGKEIRCHKPIARDILNSSVLERKYPGRYMIPSWGKLAIEDKPFWSCECPGSCAVAVCTNAVVALGEKDVQAMDIRDGRTLWKQPLPEKPMPWGLAVDRDGRVIVSLKDGRILCFGRNG